MDSWGEGRRLAQELAAVRVELDDVVPVEDPEMVY